MVFFQIEVRMFSRTACATLIGVVAVLALARAQSALPRGEVVFPDSTRVAVEVASTPAARERGLMFRTHMAPNEGMVFVFPETGHYPFWMKNTLIPLDIVWVDRQFTVVHVAASVPPCKADPCPTFPPPASPKGDALYVVELVSGFAAQHGVKAGDTLVFRNVPAPGPAVK
jgi:uncharacterized membrane protein (UPF0127 family)